MRRHTTLTSTLLASAVLATTAMIVHQKARRSEREHPPRGKFVEVDGVRLHYRERGSGPTVLLIHGNGTEAEDFVGSGLFDRLAERYRVLAIDRPGFGYSERPRDRRWSANAQALLFARACNALGARAPIVVGHSYGTQIALELALGSGLPLRGLVLVSGYYFPTSRLDSWLLAVPAIPVLGDVMRYTVSPILGRLTMHRLRAKVFAPKGVPAAFREAVPSSLMLRPWQLKAAAEDAALMIPGAAALASRYASLSTPVEIYAGLGDALVMQRKQSNRLHRQLRNSSLHIVPDEGHMLHYGRCSELVEAIDRVAQLG